jgi:hypothetical protein
MIVNVALSSKRRSTKGFLIPRIEATEPKLKYDVTLGLEQFLLFGAPYPLALDLAYIAGIIYTIDRAVPRAAMADSWTRTISVELPVAQAALWQSATEQLEEALGFLSGDIWQLSFRAANAQLFKKPSRKRKHSSMPLTTEPFKSVCLFSGGLDSFVGAVNMLHAGDRVLLVGHHDSGGPQSQQKRLFEGLKPLYGATAHWTHGRVGPSPVGAPEETLRTRSFVFVALGILAARMIGTDIPVYTPENGPIAINPPLTPSRAGSCSTRTMHPFFLNCLRGALGKVGVTNSIVNPFEFKTKGECLLQCSNQELVAALFERSVSCSHSSRRQDWNRKSAGNCGYCIPCLFRRAALHHCGMDDGQKYGIDVCKGELSADDSLRSAEDLRAVLDFLAKKYSDAEIRKLLVSVARMPELNERVQVVQRGADELRKWIASKGTAEMQAASGITTVSS